MANDPIVEEIHRHREELLRECGNDPEALVRYLQERERNSGRPVQLPLDAVKTTLEVLEERASRGNREKFEAALASLPDVEPDDYDKL